MRASFWGRGRTRVLIRMGGKRGVGSTYAPAAAHVGPPCLCVGATVDEVCTGSRIRVGPRSSVVSAHPLARAPAPEDTWR
jgi:hypothetical protein